MALPSLEPHPTVGLDSDSFCGKRQGAAGLDFFPKAAYAPLTEDVACKLTVMTTRKPPRPTAKGSCSRSSPQKSTTGDCRKRAKEAGGEDLMFREGE